MRWTDPSALRHFSVGGLAAHLARQILNVPEVLIAHAADTPPVTLFEHYRRCAWNDSDPESVANKDIRATGERAASDGPDSVLAQARRALGIVRTELAEDETGRSVFMPWEGWSLSRDDFLLTRTVELLVHSDDLAVSVGNQAPVLPDEPLQLVIDLLTRLSMYRYGPLAVLRTLARVERAPGSIAAI
ncbi:MAG TPA: maleylpyruvate isomerase N-terminal domain-containing protein [Actinocrinis sp.]|nr:maleylpyruvate isomerase N-terminal domain-containing protein [Actinocrinis sp.]